MTDGGDLPELRRSPSGASVWLPAVLGLWVGQVWRCIRLSLKHSAPDVGDHYSWREVYFRNCVDPDGHENRLGEGD